MRPFDSSKNSPLHSSPPRSISFIKLVHIDVPLLCILLTISLFGLFILYSASSGSWATVQRQAVFLAAGFGAMILTAQIPPMTFKRYTPVLYALGLVLLLAVLWKGIHAKGAQRWLDLPGLPRFQPSEIMKLAVPMMAAWFFSKKILPAKTSSLIGVLIILLVPTLLVAKQPDLGTSLLILSAGLFVVFLAGLSWRLILSSVGLGIAVAPVMWFMMYDYQRQRVLTFLSPESDPLGTGWNTIQAKTAIGSGGLSGKGWLEGTQSHLDYLPESSTDFIVAVLGEELGLLGMLFLLALYFLLIIRGLFISLEAQDTFSRLLTGSISLTFFIYVFVNIGMVSGLLPIVGVPLPLISVGGTSIVTLFTGFGILMSIQTHRRWISN